MEKLAECYDEIGICYSKKSEFKEAIEYFSLSYDIRFDLYE